MQTTQTVTVKTAVVKCDFCCATLSRPRKCPGCEKDICSNCGHWWLSDPWSGDDNGDYPPLCCDACHPLAQAMSPEAQAIQQEADERIEAIVNKWKAACMGRE